jgi:hypothetical protein
MGLTTTLPVAVLPSGRVAVTVTVPSANAVTSPDDASTEAIVVALLLHVTGDMFAPTVPFSPIFKLSVAGVTVREGISTLEFTSSSSFPQEMSTMAIVAIANILAFTLSIKFL